MGCTNARLRFWLIYVPVHFSFPKSLPSTTTAVPGGFRQTKLLQTSACCGPILLFLVCLSSCAGTELYVLSPGVCVPPYGFHFPVIYLCITHTVQVACRSFILHRAPPPWYMELLHFYITTLLPAEKTHLHTVVSSTCFPMVCVWVC